MKTILPSKVVLMFLTITISYVSKINAQESVPFTPRTTVNDVRGNMIMAGNDIVGALIQRNSNSYRNPNDPYDGNQNNGEYTTAFIDIDNDPTTFSSSSADLNAPRNECSTLVYAGLYWSANYYMQRSSTPNSFDDDEISSSTDTDVNFVINNGDLAESYEARYSDFDSDDSDIRLNPVTSYLVLAQPVNGCGITNGADLFGNIAVIQDGGSCSIREKVVNAQDEGAVGVVIVNDNNGLMPRLDGDGPTINIPSVSIGNDDITNRTTTGGNLITLLQSQTEVILATLSAEGDPIEVGLPLNDPRKPDPRSDGTRSPADFRRVKLKLPNGTNYIDIIANDIVFDGYRSNPTNPLGDVANDELPYVCYADITNLLDPNNYFGTYTVADMNATQGFTSGGDGACGGWFIVAIYEDPLDTAKFISTSDGFVQIFSGGAAVDFTYSGFTTLGGSEPIDVRYGVASLEGDVSLGGDRLRVENTSGNLVALGQGSGSVNPAGNFFNGSISVDNAYTTDRVPDSENTQGFDVDIFDLPNSGNSLIGNGQTSARFQIATDRDRYSVFFNAFSVTVIEPELRVIKRVYDTDGVTEITGQNVELGDELFYDLEIENIGNEDLVDGSVVITDILPPNTNLVSVQDATLPPGVTYAEVSPGVIEFYIPADIVETRFDDPVGEGDGPIFIRFRAQLVATCEDLRDACSDIIQNSATASYTGLITGTTRTTPSSSTLGACGDSNGEASNVLVNVPACQIDVTFCNDDLTLIAGVGYDRYTLTGPGITTPIVQELATNSAPHVFDVPNPQSGVYTIVKEDTDASNGTCMTLTEEFTVTDFADIQNPILNYVNGTTVVTEDCSGLPIPQILLCGDQTLFLETGFDPNNLDSISWQTLSPSGSCVADPNDPCSLLSGDCTDSNWVELPGGNTPDFTVSDPGDYRILAEFDGGCFIPFFFSVFKNDYQPQLEMAPIECGNDGSVTVTNVPNNFAFSLTAGGPYTNTTGVFAISTPGDVTVYAIDTTFPGCEYTATINVPSIDPTFSVTAVDPSCINDNNGTGFGRINILVTGGIPEYQYTIDGPTLTNPIIIPNSSANNGNYTQNNLPAGTYSVEVISNRPTPECIFSTSVTINPAPAFEAEVVLLAPETCETGALVQVNVINGSGNYQFADSTGVFRDCTTDPNCNIFEIPIPADPNATYTFQVSDQNVPAGEAACIIEASIDNINPYVPIVIDNVTVTAPECPGDAGQVQVTVSPTVAGRIYTYQLLDCSADPDCGVAGVEDPTLWTLVDQIAGTNNQTITFTGVPDGNSYVVSVAHNNTTPPGTTPPTICPVTQGVFSVTSPNAIDATVTLEKGLTCEVGNEDAIIRIVSASGGSGSYAWSFSPTSGFTNITSFPVDITVTTAGSYTVYIANQDATNTCPISRDVTVDPLEVINDLVITENATDCSAQTVEVTVSADPVGPTYTYSVAPAPVSGNATTGVFVLNRNVNYTFTAVRSDNQCSLDEDYFAPLLPEVDITSAVESNPVVCTGDTNGALAFTVANTTAFDWEVRDASNNVVGSGSETGTDPTTVTLGSLGAGTYTINVTDTALATTGACTDTATVTITEPANPLTFTTTATESNCSADTGTITVTATGGRGNYQYRIVNSGGTVIVDYPNTNNVFTGLAVDTYTIFVRDGNDPATACEVSDTETIIQFASPTIALTAGGDQCYDGTNQASQIITITPGIDPPLGPFEYILDRGSGPETPVAITLTTAPYTFEITGLTPGSYTVFVRNTNTQCTTNTESFTINPELTITATLDKDIDCNGDAIISFTAAGGTGTYAYEIFRVGTPDVSVETNATSPYSTNLLTPGDYYVQVVDSQNCTANSNPVTVTAYEALAANHTITEPPCPNETGTITVNVTAGEGPFIYVLDGTTTIGPTSNTSVTFNNVAAGTHSVEITDGSGASPACTLTLNNIDIVAPTPISGTVAITQDYSCDASGSSATPILGEITTTVSDPGDATAPLEFSIDGVNWQASNVFTGLTDGTYTVLVRGANTAACPVSLAPVTIDPLVQVTDLSFVASQVQCPALTSSVVVSATLDGTSTVEYRIAAPAGESTAFSTNDTYTLNSGTTYTFEARTTVDGCIYSENFTAPVIDFIAVNGTVVSEPSCNGFSDGELSFTVSGIDLTTTTYAYQITEGGGAIAPINATGQNTATISSGGILPAGVYTVLVTDETTLCTATTTITLTDPALLGVTATVTSPLTCVQNATITATASGGNGGNQFSLLDAAGTTTIVGFQASNVFSVSTAATYTVRVRDAQGCTDDVSVTVDAPDPVLASITSDDLCYDPTDPNTANVTIDITSGQPPYSYAVNGGTSIAIVGTNFTINGLNPGSYAIVITDSFGCEATINQTIQPQITIAASLLKDLDCTASPDAQIQVTTTGGNGGNTITVDLDGSAGVPNFVTIPVSWGAGPIYNVDTAGTYQFRVTDSEGCVAISSDITVTPATLPTVTSVDPTNIACNGDATGIITFNGIAVGTPPFQTSIDGGTTFTSQTVYSGLTAGPYTWIIRDAKECEITGSVTITEPAAITANIIDSPITCTGGVPTLSTITVNNVAGGTVSTTGYTYTLYNADGTIVTAASLTTLNPTTTTATSLDFEFLDFGDYYAIIEDENGCSFRTPTVTVETAPSDLDFTYTGGGTCLTGAIYDIQIINGTPPFTIEFEGAVGPIPTNGIPNGGAAGSDSHREGGLLFDFPYNVIITDAGGCELRRRLDPPEPSPSGITATATGIDMLCTGDSPGTGGVNFDVDGYTIDVTLDWEIFNSDNTTTGITGSASTVGLGGATFSGSETNQLDVGSYFIVITESGAGAVGPFCTATAEFQVGEPTPLFIDLISQDQANCNIDALVVVRGRGGTAPYSYTADDGVNPVITSSDGTFILPATVAGTTYAITVTDNNSCTSAAINVTVTRIPDPTIDNISPVVDPCIFDGAFEFTVTATGQSQLEFGIDDGDTSTTDVPVFVNGNPTGNPNEYEYTFVVSGPSVDQYTITVRDANGCIDDTGVVIIHPELMVDADFSTEPTCFNSNAGEVTATVTGGSNNATNWSVVLLDGLGNPTGIPPVFTAPNIYTFSPVPTGDYEVQVTDTNPQSTCVASDTFSRAALVDPIVILEEVDDETCNGFNDGSILVSLDTSTDDDPPYVYDLYSGAIIAGVPLVSQPSNPLFTGLTPGTYSIRVTSVLGCTGDLLNIIVDPATNPTSSPSLESGYSCSGPTVNFPVITLTDPTGGSGGPYRIEYTITPSGTNVGPVEASTLDTDSGIAGIQIIANEEGDYTFTIYDSNNCSNTLSPFTINPFPIMTDAVVNQVTPIDCNTNTEEVTVTVTGGAGAYNFVEINGSGLSQLNVPSGGLTTTSGSFLLPGVGSYVFEVTDLGTGCTIQTLPYEVLPYDTIEANIAVVAPDILCFGDNTGNIELTVTGHTGPYNYTVTNTTTGTVTGPIGADTTVSNPITIGGLESGNIVVNIIDPASGCFDNSNVVFIDQPAELTLALVSNDNAFCTSNGRVIVEATGGTPPYTFTADDGVNPPITNNTGDFSLPGSIAGITYTISVTDANSCSSNPVDFDTTVFLTPEPTLDTLTVDDICDGDNNGSYIITATGTSFVPAPGTQALRFQLDGGAIVTANNGLNSHQFVVNAPGTYQVTIYDENNCTDSSTITIPPALIASASFTIDPTCRVDDGTVTVTVQGGSDFSSNPGNFTFTLFGTDILGNPVSVTQVGSNVFTGVRLGNYQVTITDDFSPTVTCSITVNVTRPPDPVDPIITAAGQAVSCVNGTDGRVTITLTNPITDDAPYTYQLFVDDGFGNPDLSQQIGVDQIDNPVFNDVPVGDFVAVVTSDRGCPGQALVNVPNASQVTAGINTSNYGCTNPGNDEIFPVITITIDNGTPPYSVSYDTPSGNTITVVDVADANGNPADGVQYEILADEEGNYIITVTDFNGCNTAPTTITEAVGPFPIMTNPLVTVNTPISCPAGEDVLVTVEGISTGLYDFVETTGSGLSVTNVTFGTNDIGATAQTETGALFTLPGVGVYVFEITDQDTGCIITVSHEIQQFDNIMTTANQQTPESCFGDANGQAVVTITGYAGDLSYQIVDTGVTPEVVVFTSTVNLTTDGDVNTADTFLVPPAPAGLTTGNYRIDLTEVDAPFCTDSAVFTILGPAIPLDLTITPINDTEFCDPAANGSVQASVTGAQGNVTYELARTSAPTVVIDSNTTGRFEGLTADQYQITVIDDNGTFSCTDVEIFDINPPADDVAVVLVPTNVSCFGEVDGSIVVNATGTNSPFEYTITPNGGTESGRQTSNEFNFLSANTYTINVYDQLGCSGSETIQITEPNEVTVTIDDVTLVTCAINTVDVTVTGNGDFPIESHVAVNVTDNNNPVETVVTTNAATYTFIGLVAGEYQFYVIDVNGCRSQLSAPVPVVPIDQITFELDLDAANVNCTDEPSGIVDISSITGGIGDYRFRLTNTTTGQVWPTGGGTQAESEFRDLPPGQYEYYAESDRGCSAIRTFTIINPPLFERIDPEVTNVVCFGEDNGSIVVFAQGGTPPYAFAISTNPNQFFADDSDDDPNQHTFTDLVPGTYQVFAQDANGCGQVYDVVIGEPEMLVATIDGDISPETCAGDMDGAVTIAITGGTPPYFTNITNNDNDFVQDQLTYDMLPGGQTTIFIRDSNNCRTEIVIDVPPGVVLGADLLSRLECPIFDYSDTENPVMIQGPTYFVTFELNPGSVTTGIDYMLTGINGTADPVPSINTTGEFEVLPGEYEGTMIHEDGCVEPVGTIVIEEYTPLSIPIAQMTNNPQDPNEYEIIVTGGSGNPDNYTYFIAILEDGMTVDQLQDSDFTELAGNIFSIEETAVYVIRVIDEMSCEVLGIQELEFINIVIPNYFTPDQDQASTPDYDDRFWYPRQIPGTFSDTFFFNDIEVKIFDRYGRLLAEYKGQQKGWGGLYQGKELPSGDYWYSIILNDKDNRTFTGHFTLYR